MRLRQTRHTLLFEASILIGSDNADEYFTVTECGSQRGSEALRGAP